MEEAKITRGVSVGNLVLGGGMPVLVQSMTNTRTSNVQATIDQIRKLKRAGCEIVRIAVPDEESAQAIAGIRASVDIPLVADIHFNYKLALLSVEYGIDKLRINPGNIGGQLKIREVVAACKDRGIPIRIGVNSGSVERTLLNKYGGPTVEAMTESALKHASLLEAEGFYDIVISIKASGVKRTIEANRYLAGKVDYPLHIGITEAGGGMDSMAKSAVGLGTLLMDGIGDTIRVSMTGDPVQEVHAAWRILNATEVRRRGIDVVSCPTCARTNGEMAKIASEIKRKLPKTTKPLKVAVMGCAVNGPGEAREADIGCAFGPTACVLFAHGEKIRSIPHDQAVDTLLTEIRKLLK